MFALEPIEITPPLEDLERRVGNRSTALEKYVRLTVALAICMSPLFFAGQVFAAESRQFETVQGDNSVWAVASTSQTNTALYGIGKFQVRAKDASQSTIPVDCTVVDEAAEVLKSLLGRYQSATSESSKKLYLRGLADAMQGITATQRHTVNLQLEILPQESPISSTTRLAMQQAMGQKVSLVAAQVNGVDAAWDASTIHLEEGSILRLQQLVAEVLNTSLPEAAQFQGGTFSRAYLSGEAAICDWLAGRLAFHVPISISMVSKPVRSPWTDKKAFQIYESLVAHSESLPDEPATRAFFLGAFLRSQEQELSAELLEAYWVMFQTAFDANVLPRKFSNSAELQSEFDKQARARAEGVTLQTSRTIGRSL